MWNILRQWLVRVGILLFTLLLCLGLFEIGCRIVGVDFSPNPVWKFHPVLGWTQEPGKVYEYLVDGHMVRVEFNGLGFRDVEHALRKPAGKKRIVLIGDSLSEAIEVSLEETFFRRLQSDLNQSGEDQWEVTEAIFRKTHALCQARGITVVPLVIPFEVRVREGWERFAASHPRARMIQDYPEQRFSRLFEDLRVPGVFMKSVFEANLDVFLPTRAGHLNPGAHDLVARTILEKLTEVGLVD